MSRDQPGGLTPKQVVALNAKRRAEQIKKGPPKCIARKCGKQTAFDPKVVGMTCGGLYLRGWYMCPDGHGQHAGALAEVCEAPVWRVAKGGRSVELSTGRIRWGAFKVETNEGLDVAMLMERVARVPDLEREVIALRARLEAVSPMRRRRTGSAE